MLGLRPFGFCRGFVGVELPFRVGVADPGRIAPLPGGGGPISSHPNLDERVVATVDATGDAARFVSEPTVAARK